MNTLPGTEGDETLIDIMTVSSPSESDGAFENNGGGSMDIEQGSGFGEGSEVKENHAPLWPTEETAQKSAPSDVVVPKLQPTNKEMIEEHQTSVEKHRALIDKIDSETVKKAMQRMGGKTSCIEIRNTISRSISSLADSQTDLTRRILAVLSYDTRSFSKHLIRGTVVWSLRRQQQPNSTNHKRQPTEEAAIVPSKRMAVDKPLTGKPRTASTPKPMPMPIPIPPTPTPAPPVVLPEEMDDVCDLCQLGTDADQIILCDGLGCGRGYHIYCLRPSLKKVPEGEWRCPICVAEHVPVDPMFQSQAAAPVAAPVTTTTPVVIETPVAIAKPVSIATPVPVNVPAFAPIPDPFVSVSNAFTSLDKKNSQFFIPVLYYLRKQKERGIISASLEMIYEAVKHTARATNRAPFESLTNFLAKHTSFFAKMGPNQYGLSGLGRLTQLEEEFYKVFGESEEKREKTRDVKMEEERDMKIEAKIEEKIERKIEEMWEKEEDEREIGRIQTKIPEGADLEVVEDFEIMATSSPTDISSFHWNENHTDDME
ncbi:hypothetical protein PROFUN_00461 [Planoprotostelium fungivorum]|uniref:PHD-type domain-containing protein n=1 Tax=Planoprotostelium fungivorum TaxID=1890364 RepID=A0A2P6N119_9EUKA|nr:hypothetical protein PROFUN_00461 [Planoprotostelium fungivorum]